VRPDLDLVVRGYERDDLRRLNLLLVLGVGKLRFFNDRGEDDEDDEQDQQHVREGRDVDRRHHFFFALSSGDGHGAEFLSFLTR
jgi:hypothetical protein